MKFDSRTPFNDLPLLPPKFDFDQIEILKRVNTSNIAIAKLNALSTKIPNPWLLMQPLLVRESVASSGIENINTTVLEVFEAEVQPDAQRRGPAKEVLRYREAMLKGLDYVTDKGFLSTNHMIDIQEIIEPGKPGIRKVPGTRIMNSTTKVVLYTPPDGEKRLRDFLANLEQYINRHDDDIDQLIKMAVLHYQFESIHPFLDGNGRVGRIIMILHLILTKRLELPVLFLSGYIEKHKSEYYKFLQQTRSGDFGPFILYILKAVEMQANVTASTVQDIEKLMAKTEATIKREFPSRAHDLMLCIFSRPFLTIEYVQTALSLSARQTASKYLAQLAEKKILRQKKIGRGKLFYCPPFLKLLEE